MRIRTDVLVEAKSRILQENPSATLSRLMAEVGTIPGYTKYDGKLPLISVFLVDQRSRRTGRKNGEG